MLPKKLSELIDELSITNCKIFALMDGEETSENFVKVKELNGYRSELKNAINSYFNERGEIKV